jgi:hypothetical protein
MDLEPRLAITKLIQILLFAQSEIDNPDTKLIQILLFAQGEFPVDANYVYRRTPSQEIMRGICRSNNGVYLG